MSRRSIERILWLVALVAGAAAWSGSRAAAVKTPRPRIPSLEAPAEPHAYSQTALAQAERRVVDSDAFRLERRPASAAFQRQVSGMVPGAGMPFAPPPPPKFRPPLALTGIVGPPWQALLEGLPNQQGAVVVRQGETYGDLRIRTVRPDLVVVQGPDTTWRLTLKPKWQ